MRAQKWIIFIAVFIGFGGAVASTSRHRYLAYKIYGQRVGLWGNYYYTNKAGTFATGSCLSNAPMTVCTFSSTATAAYFNTYNVYSFPTNNSNPQQGPMINFIATGKIYR